jgi:Mediator complex subunit 15
MGRQPSNQGLPQMGMSTQGHQSQPFPSTQRTQSVKPGPQPTQHVPLPGGKGNKRMSDDDVVEISGPVAGAQPRPQSSQIPGKQMPSLTQDIIDKMSPTTRQQYDSLRAQNQLNQQQAIKQRIIELNKEVQGTMPLIVLNKSMDPDSRARILKVLTSDDTKNMLGRFDQLLAPYLLLTKDDAAVKRLISQRLHFLHQYKPNSVPTKVFEPQDNFSISADYAEAAMKEMIAKFQQTLERTQKPAALRHPGLPPSQAHQPLSQENLRQLQEQNEAQRKIKGTKPTDVPPAPTAPQPPFPIGDSRGHGTPRYATQGLKQEDLKLDPNKKRKKNPPGTAASTPATNQGTPAPVASLEQTKAKKPEVNSFKCAVTGCEYQIKGFQTKNELDAHAKDAHKPPETPIADTKAFFIEQTRHGLGLDENGRPLKKVDTQRMQEGSKAPLMQRSTTKASAANVKMESKPSTPAAMARHTSQTGNKAGSPVSNSSKTPQLDSGKVAGDNSAGAAVTVAGNNVGAEGPDTSLWDSSPINLSSLQETFNDINMDGVMALDPGLDIENLMDMYMQSDVWSKTRPELNAVPADDSSNESPAQNSEGDGARQPSHDSDTSKSAGETFVKVDDIDILMPDVDESWMLPELAGQDKAFDADDDEWMYVQDVTFDQLNMSEDEGEPWKDIDWEKDLEGQNENENGNVGIGGIKA